MLSVAAADAGARPRLTPARNRPSHGALCRRLGYICAMFVHSAAFYDALLDVNGAMREVARARNPGVPLHETDVADFSLDARFDVVTCLVSSIAYVRTLGRRRSAVAAMRAHLRPGGVIVVEPWFTPESYWTGTITANHVDQPDLKIAWMYTSERERDRSVLDIHHLLGRPQGVERYRERHELGRFTREQHLAALRDVGLTPRYESDGLFDGRGLYVARDGG